MRAAPGKRGNAMMAWSVVVGVAGILATWIWVTCLARRPSFDPFRAWLLGLAALLPAWLIGFLGLLGTSTGERPEPSVSIPFILSSSAALLGIILSDAAVRRFRESGREHRPVTYWLLGVAAVFPAWCLALLGLTWTRP